MGTTTFRFFMLTNSNMAEADLDGFGDLVEPSSSRLKISYSFHFHRNVWINLMNIGYDILP